MYIRKLILENLVMAKQEDERGDLTQTLNYLKKVGSPGRQVQVLEKKPEPKGWWEKLKKNWQ